MKASAHAKGTGPWRCGRPRLLFLLLLAIRAARGIRRAFRELRLLSIGRLDRSKEVLVVADRESRFAVWRACVCKARAAFVQIDGPGVVAFDHHALVLNDIMSGIESDDVGDAERLAGDDEQISILKRDVGDRRIADDDLAGRAGKMQKLRLVVADNQVAGRCASG